MVEGGLNPGDDNFNHHLDLCLQCMACHSVCPTGVSAGEIVARTKSYIRATSRANLPRRIGRAIVYKHVLPSHGLMEAGAIPLQLYCRSGTQRLARSTGLTRMLPGPARFMEELLPARMGQPLRRILPDVVPAVGEWRRDVAFHLTCVNNVMLPAASASAVRVLSFNGCSVRRARSVGCCGAPHETVGEMSVARALARRNIAAYELMGSQPVISDAAACGAVMKNYGHWLRDDPVWSERAKSFSGRVRDIHEFLIDLGPRPPAGRIDTTVTYSDPCHLCHAQGISSQPRKLLAAIPGLRFAELRDASRCCGSAGTYNIEQPDMAEIILAEKMARVRESGAAIVTSANPGCLLQLEAGARKYRVQVRVRQVTQLLAASYDRGL